LACGLDAGYPAGHARLLQRMVGHGAVVSEYPPGTPPARHRFLVRNRLIAAMSAGVVVVEAGVRSGARNTAVTAGALGKSVMALPRPIGSAMSAGCHQMLRRGVATLVTSMSEIVDTAGPLSAGAAEEVDGSAVATQRPTDGLSPVAARIHDALATRTAKAAERVASESGVSLGEVRATLPLLELDGMARRDDGGWRR